MLSNKKLKLWGLAKKAQDLVMSIKKLAVRSTEDECFCLVVYIKILQSFYPRF